MNVFDDEMELLDQDAAARLSLLAQSGLTLEELRVWSKFTGAVN